MAIQQTQETQYKNQPRDAGGTRDDFRIPLTRGLFAIVDEADFARVSAHKWSIHDNGRGGLYAARVVKGERILLHRFIKGAGPDDPQIDHGNRRPLDCRQSNLRWANDSQNGANRGKLKRTGGTNSQFRGVSRDSTGRWRVRLKKDGRDVYGGVFVDEIDAAREYNHLARLVHGAFAFQNEVQA